MAGGDIGNLVVSVGIDSSLFEKGVKEIDKSMSLLKSEFSATSSKLKEFGSDTDKIQNKAQFLGKAMQLQEQKVKELAKAYEKSKQETGENSKATQELGIKLNQAISGYNKFESELKQTQNALKATENDAEKQGNVFDKLKDKVAGAFDGMGEHIKRGIGMAIGGDIWDKAKEGFVTMMTFGSDLTKSLNGVQAATGFSNEAMAKIHDTMISIYNDNFGESFEDIGNAVKVIGQQSGESGEGLKRLTENALLLRDTFDFDVNESFRSAKMLMDQFGVSGDEAYNLIAQGAQWGLDKNNDLLDTINEYSVHFKQIGLDSDEMFNMLLNGAASGTFSVDKLGDAVKEFGIRVKDGSTTTSQAFKSLGLDVNKTGEAFAKGGEDGKKAFVEVNKKLLEMKDPLKQNQIGVQLYGSMWEDLGVTGIKALTDLNGEIDKSSDSLQKINKVKYNDLGSAFEGIKRNLQTGILIPLSEKLLPKLSEFSNWFLANMPNIQSSVSGALDSMAPVFDALGKAIMFVVQNANWLIPALIGVVAGVGAFSIMSTIAGIVTLFAGAIEGVTGVMAILNAVFLACPLVWIAIGIGVVVAAAILLYKHWDLVKAKTIEVWTAIKEFIWNKLVEIGSHFGFIGLAVAALIKHWDGIKSTAIAVFNTVRDAIINFKNYIVQKFTEIGIAISNAWNFIKNVVTVGIMLIGSIIKAAVTIILLPWMFIWENCKTYIISAWNFISSKVSSALSFVGSIIRSVFSAVSAFISSVWNGIKSIISAAWSHISSVVSAGINFVKSIISSGFNAAKSLISSVWNSIKSVISAAWSYISSIVSSGVNAVKNVVSSGFNAVKSTAVSIFNSIKSSISSIWSSLVGIFSSIGGSIRSAVSGVFDGVRNAVSEKMSAAKEAVSSGISAIKGFFSGLSLKLPSISLPHFSVEGSFSVNPPSVPHFAVDWYANGGIFSKPQVIGVGDAKSPEVVAPLDKLQGFIDKALDKKGNGITIQNLNVFDKGDQEATLNQIRFLAEF